MVCSGQALANPFDQRFTGTSGTAVPRRGGRSPARARTRVQACVQSGGSPQPVMATGASHASRSTVIVWPPRVSLLLTRYWWPRLCPVNWLAPNGQSVVVVLCLSHRAYQRLPGRSVLSLAFAIALAL